MSNSGASASAVGSRPSSPPSQAAAKHLRPTTQGLNPFATLTDHDDMDAEPGTLLAPQPPADSPAPDAATS